MGAKRWAVILFTVIALSWLIWYSPSLRVSPFANMHVVYEEWAAGWGGRAEYEMWFNDEGHFRVNVNSGPYKGKFKIWDGENIYEYDPNQNQVTSPQPGGYAPSAGWPVSYGRLALTLEDIESGKMKKTGDATVLGLEVGVYEKVEEMRPMPHVADDQSGSADSQAPMETRITVVMLDHTKKFTLDETVYVNGMLHSKTTFKRLEMHTFDPALLIPNPPPSVKPGDSDQGAIPE